MFLGCKWEFLDWTVLWNVVYTVNSGYFCCSWDKGLMRGRLDWGPQLKAHSPSWEKAGYWGQPPFQGRAERRCSEEPGEMGQNLPFAKFPRNIETRELAAACRWNWGFTLAGDCHSMAQRSTCFRGMQHDAASYQSAQRQSSHGPLCPECVPEQKNPLKPLSVLHQDDENTLEQKL